MAIGGGFSSNNGNGMPQQQNNNDYTYYSRLKFKNNNRALDISFRAGLLILTIGELAEGSFKAEPLISMYLSPMKAAMLCEEIKKFVQYKQTAKKIDPNKGFGVNGGINKDRTSYIAVSANEDKNTVITIGKFNNEGIIIESYQYTFVTEYNNALEWSNIEKNELERVFYDNIEFEMLYKTVDDFARFSNGSMAYTVADLERYDYNRILRRLEPIYDKLGIERRDNSNFNRSFGTNNFLNNSSSTHESSNHVSYDSFESALLGDDDE